MHPRTIHIGSAYHISVKQKQLVLEPKEEGLREGQMPIEDLAFVVLEHPHITLTQAALQVLAEHNVCVIFCNEKHLPTSMLLHLDTHYVQAERFSFQLQASEPLSKQLWAQTIKAKILNQATLLEHQGVKAGDIEALAKQVKSGDTGNEEAQAARRYWPRLMHSDFLRDRVGDYPNNLLNYGYTLLRAATARALCGVGLLPLLGIHHHNRYNHYALADDIMEPYRPFVDLVVKKMMNENTSADLTKEQKTELLKALVMNVCIADQQTNMLQALQITAQSLADCFEGSKTKLKLPNLAATLKAIQSESADEDA